MKYYKSKSTKDPGRILKLLSTYPKVHLSVKEWPNRRRFLVKVGS